VPASNSCEPFVLSETTNTKTGARFAHTKLPSIKTGWNFAKSDSVFATIKRQGWLLPAEGAHRAASNRRFNTSSATGVSAKARGDQRFKNTSEMSCSAVPIFFAW